MSSITNETHHAMAFDPLFCQEEPFVFIEEEEEEEPSPDLINYELTSHSDELLSSLIANEQKAHNFAVTISPINDPYLHSARREAIEWIKAASSRCGFNTLTVILAVNYIDRCFLRSPGLRLQQDKPWMKQLSAVACLSLAAKVEETHVPLLLDLQLSGSDEVTGFVFESKTIRRMELLVLSTLGWRMNPPTATAFIQCILPKLKRMDVMKSCESVLLSVLSDYRWVHFPPSVWASAAMFHSMGHHLDEMQQVLELLQVSKDKMEECHSLIEEIMGSNKKRKFFCYSSEPPSPNGVIGSCFSYESSSSLDSWTTTTTRTTTTTTTMWASSVTSSPEPPPSKRPNCSSSII